MYIQEVGWNFIASLIAGIASLLAAVTSQYMAQRWRRDKEKFRKEAETIAEVVGSEEAARKASVIERVIERIPVGLSQEQFATLLNEIATRIPTGQASVAVADSAVENLINNYHEQALSQAKAQFWFSVVAASIGFAWILFAGGDIKPDNFVTVSKTLPGVVMDAVAFLFFKQASETRQRATELYDRLRKDKLVSESVSLVSSIEDIRVRSAVKAQIALQMSGLQPAPIDLSTFLSRDGEESPRKKPEGDKTI
ncbi:MAG TPA: hypothetical protein VI298_10505 [Geobacteraceae bacterium]